MGSILRHQEAELSALPIAFFRVLFPGLWVEEKVSLQRGPAWASVWVQPTFSCFVSPEADGERLLPSVAVTLTVLSAGLTLQWAWCSHLLPSCRDETLEMTGLWVAWHLDQIRLPWDVSFLRAPGRRWRGLPPVCRQLTTQDQWSAFLGPHFLVKKRRSDPWAVCTDVAGSFTYWEHYVNTAKLPFMSRISKHFKMSN